jgi:ubiquinone/menaquinone biosynthesis C-methylase UbiE
MTTQKRMIKQPTCPWWFLFTFDNPFRKLYQNPERILAPYIKAGDRVADLGCGMGYFSLPLAKLVGNEGKVVAVDLQSQMLAGLKQRAYRAGLQDRIDLHQCTQEKIWVTGPMDFVLAFWMVHEVHDSRSFLEQIWKMLKYEGQLLIVEPLIHVRKARFQQLHTEVVDLGFKVVGSPSIGFSRSILAQKGD